MVKDEVLTVKDAVYKLQLSLLEGIKLESQLSAAGSVISRSDYQDVVTERTIANLCGYPLCSNALPSERPWKGKYRISLKEHKVYDLQETYMYCSSSCLISSRSFAESLPEERSLDLKPAKLNEVVKLFDSLSLDSVLDMGKNGDLGMSELKIEEKTDTKTGEVSMEEWIGSSNAIDGYVPRKERKAEPESSNNLKKGSRQEKIEPKPRRKQPDLSDSFFDDMNFSSTIIIEDGYSISKNTPNLKAKDFEGNLTAEHGKTTTKKEKLHSSEDSSGASLTSPSKKATGGNELNIRERSAAASTSVKPSSKISLEEGFGPSNATDSYMPCKERSVEPECSKNLKKGARQKKAEPKPRSTQPDLSDIFSSTIIIEDGYSISKNDPYLKSKEVELNSTGKRGKATAMKDKLRSSEDASGARLTGPRRKDTGENELCNGEESSAGSVSLKPSLKNSVSNRLTRSVTWADEEANGAQDLCEYSEHQNKKGAPGALSSDKEVRDDSNRFVSVEACAMGLSQAAEAVASGKSDVPDALSEAGIMIWPPGYDVNEAKFHEYSGDMETETGADVLKWPPKPSFSNADLFDSEDSWCDGPPEGFSLALSPFSTMFMALFAWLSSSSLAYIYGRDDSCHEDFSSVNGREYPRKIVLPDGLSTEIKQTLEVCLSQALPGLVADLRLRIPVSILERGMGRLIGTMSFVDPLPAFRIKQWHIIILLFFDALSVNRIPALTEYLMDRRIFLTKVLEGAQISAEEYELMKDLILPLGRVPAFSSQSGG